MLNASDSTSTTSSACSVSDEDRRGLTAALFWSNVNPYGTFRLDMDKRLDLGPATAAPRLRIPADTAARSTTEAR
jgi:hypothetical protein